MLVHQAKRLNSPNILITNHDSSVMPNFNIVKSDGTTEKLKLVNFVKEENNSIRYLFIFSLYLFYFVYQIR